MISPGATGGIRTTRKLASRIAPAYSWSPSRTLRSTRWDRSGIQDDRSAGRNLVFGQRQRDRRTAARGNRTD